MVFNRTIIVICVLSRLLWLHRCKFTVSMETAPPTEYPVIQSNQNKGINVGQKESNQTQNLIELHVNLLLPTGINEGKKIIYPVTFIHA